MSTRYDRDSSAPTVGQAARDALVRAALPAVVLFGVVVGLGLLITGPLHGLPAEQAVSRRLAAGRTSTMNTLTSYGSLTGSTYVIAASMLVAVLLLWWATRRWWIAIVPAIAVGLELAVFLGAVAIIGRPRPDVPHLDQAPPTSSFPSGHTGAATALYLSLALLAQRIRTTWVRVLLTVVCVLVPFAVGYSRVYRGMHNVTDVAVGLLNGATCAALAYGYLRRDTTGREPSAGAVGQAPADERPALPAGRSPLHAAGPGDAGGQAAPSSAAGPVDAGGQAAPSSAPGGRHAAPGAPRTDVSLPGGP